MSIYLIDDEQNIKLIENGSLWIKAKPEWKREDILLYASTTLCFFEQENVSGESYARKAADLSGSSIGAVRIFDELFKTYHESQGFEITKSKFNQVDDEKIYNSIATIVERVKKHKKITEKEAKVLLQLFNGEKTKKQLVKEGICSFVEIEYAYNCFMQEIEWCYGFKDQINIHRAEQFNLGEIQFCYSMKDFSNLYSIDETLLKKIAYNVIESQKILNEETVTFFRSIIEKDNFENGLSENERKRVREIVDSIVGYFLDSERSYYRTIAEELIQQRIVHVNDIHKYCVKNAIDYWKTTHSMEKLGIKPDHHIRQRKYLKKMLEEDNE